MKKIIFIVLLTTQFFFAQSGFDRGNYLYQKGRYQEAIKEYESVLASQQHSSELYFNLGNCYYKLNKVAPAVYNYEKALVLNPDDAEITNNLKFANKMQIDEMKRGSYGGVFKNNSRLYFHLSLQYLGLDFGGLVNTVFGVFYRLLFFANQLVQKDIFHRNVCFALFAFDKCFSGNFREKRLRNRKTGYCFCRNCRGAQRASKSQQYRFYPP